MADRAFLSSSLTIVVFTGLSVLATDANASLRLEYDYGAAPSGGVINASVAVGGSSQADVVGSASINSGTALGAGYDPKLVNGFMSVPNTNGSGSVSKDTGGGNNTLYDYQGGVFIDQGTIVAVFKPHFSGLAASRKTFFRTGGDVGGNKLWLYNDDDVKGPALMTSSTNFASATQTSISNFNWDSNTWYFLAASFSNSLQDANIYIRALQPGGVAQSNSNLSATINTDNGFSDQPMYIGHRSDGGSDPGDSDFALFQYYNDYKDISGLSQLYSSMIVPEPSCVMLVLVGVALPLTRARRSVV